MIVSLVSHQVISKEAESYYYVSTSNYVIDKADKCDAYVRDNNTSVQSLIKKIITSYKNNNYEKTKKMFSNPGIETYIEQLRICSVFYKFSGDINHYSEAYLGMVEFVTGVEVYIKSGQKITDIDSPISMHFESIQVVQSSYKKVPN